MPRSNRSRTRNTLMRSAPTPTGDFHNKIGH
jgi:hypothetical protein